MNKNEYLERLEKGLGSMSYSDVKDIMSDISEHFEAGISNGKSEADICNELGTPEELAKAYMEGAPLPKALIKAPVVEENKQADSSVSTGGVLFVIFFNLIIALPVWFTLLSFILGLVSIDIALIAAIIAMIPVCAVLGNFIASGILLTIIIFLLAVMSIVISYFSIKYFIIGTVKYFKWNVKVWKNGF